MKTNKGQSLILSRKRQDYHFSDYQERLCALENQTVLLLKQVDDLKAIIALKDAQIAEKDSRIAVLEAKVIELETTFNAPKKTSRNSSSRPSSDYKSNKPDDKDAPKKKRKGHGKGGRPLHPNQSQTFEMKLTQCPNCGGSLDEESQQLYAAYDKIELPEIHPLITRVHLYKCQCRNCDLSSVAPAPVGYEPGSPFTDSVAKELIDLKYNHFMSYKRLSSYMADRFQISVSQGAIASVFKKYTGRFDARVSEILERIRKSRLVCSDETSARVRGNNEWEWVFQNESVCLHVIRPCRGASVVDEVMSGHRPEFWVSDLYSSQQNHAKKWQICLAHQLRDCEYSIQEGEVYFSWRLKKLILKAIALHRRRHRPFVLNNLEKWRTRLEDELEKILEFEPETPSGKRLKKRYLKHGKNLFTFLEDPQAIPPTNNGSERSIRLSTIYRRVTGGFRSDWGKHLFAAVRSVVNTGQKQKFTPRQSIQRAMGIEPSFLLT